MDSTTETPSSQAGVIHQLSCGHTVSSMPGNVRTRWRCASNCVCPQATKNTLGEFVCKACAKAKRDLQAQSGNEPLDMDMDDIKASTFRVTNIVKGPDDLAMIDLELRFEGSFRQEEGKERGLTRQQKIQMSMDARRKRLEERSRRAGREPYDGRRYRPRPTRRSPSPFSRLSQAMSGVSLGTQAPPPDRRPRPDNRAPFFDRDARSKSPSPARRSRSPPASPRYYNYDEFIRSYRQRTPPTGGRGRRRPL
ncbi:hypothetical protein K402DRAFT_422928 [Aulographum hederae CBS 113979]|uniref:Uncharacterized protein n=1 Tax=Aulographum hederae CBS 113979 TaxID=1176131 RepID=A0A6G1GUF6_9PEZI|nr:hypothetical protein K402DRAFT_422928 [Aulographum hederae CBS 113979]